MGYRPAGGERRGSFPRILVKFPNWIGDSVLAGPLVGALRSHWPRGHISVFARPGVRAVAERMPGVSEVVGEDYFNPLAYLRRMRAGCYDVSFSLSSNLAIPVALALARVPVRIGFTGDGVGPFLTSGLAPMSRAVHQVDHYLALASLAGVARPKEPRLAWGETDADSREADAFLRRREVRGRNLVALAPGASFGPAKRWPAVSWAELAGRLALEDGATVVLVGGRAEEKVAGRIWALSSRHPVNASGYLGLGGTAALLARCRAFVSNDSGLMHVGAAVGVPTVGLFGGSNPHWTRPYGRRHATVWGHVPCSPCYRRRCVRGRDYACQAAITVERVLAVVRDIRRR